MFDRIDETFKYDRVKQEAVVQALLQAEGRVSLFEHIGLVVFLRTDLFELYDIQEKNKLISRMLTLDWSEEEWLQVLVRRVLANEPFERLARRLHVAGDRRADHIEVITPLIRPVSPVACHPAKPFTVGPQESRISRRITDRRVLASSAANLCWPAPCLFCSYPRLGPRG